MQDQSTESIEPQPNELWLLYRESDSDARLSIAEVDAVLDDGTYRLTLLYDTISAVETPTQMEGQPKSIFHAKLPDHDEWTEQYEELLDHARRHITLKDVADLLDGEPTHETNGERGYDALRFFALNGISESITEHSVHQGHGPSRYASAVERRLDDAPKHLIEDVLSSEQNRWDSGVELSEDAASKLVEILLLRKQHLGDEVESDISRIVNEYDLDYDEYREDT